MLEYDGIVVVGQTHSRKTHSRYYVKSDQLKRQRYEEATKNQETFERIFPPQEIRPDNYEQINPVVNVAPSTGLPLSISPPNECDSTRIQDRVPDIYEEMRSLVNSLPSTPILNYPRDEDGFGTARPDLIKKGKRFEWTSKEIQHLQYYILNIEPSLSETEKSNKYASCLSYLRSAEAHVKQDFHPNHVLNSGRIKTGYDNAVDKFRQMLDNNN